MKSSIHRVCGAAIEPPQAIPARLQVNYQSPRLISTRGVTHFVILRRTGFSREIRRGPTRFVEGRKITRIPAPNVGGCSAQKRAPQRRRATSSSNRSAQLGAKRPVVLDVPLATHSVIAGFATFGIKQGPFPPSSRLGTNPRIVLLKAPFKISRPADVGSAVIFASATQHINEKQRFAFWGVFSHGQILFCTSAKIGRWTRTQPLGQL
jgi:hypothetical protein